jgi:chromosome segregation ATPase
MSMNQSPIEMVGQIRVLGDELYKQLNQRNFDIEGAIALHSGELVSLRALLAETRDRATSAESRANALEKELREVDEELDMLRAYKTNNAEVTRSELHRLRVIEKRLKEVLYTADRTRFFFQMNSLKDLVSGLRP